MLTNAQLYHFAVHGWVLQEDVFQPEEIEAFKKGLDDLYAAKVSTMVHTEALIHTGVPILSERTRYTMFYGFTPPWMQCWPGSSPSQEIIDQSEGELKEILGARTGYMGQYGPE